MSLQELNESQKKEVISKISNYLEFIFKELVDYPNNLRVEPKVGPQTVCFYVIPDRRDYGKVIGKNGRLVSAVRELLLSLCAKYNIRCVLCVDDV